VLLYQALYRKWRPRVFEDVAGQPNITVTLKNEVVSGRIGHAYIFTGSRGTGKTSCAKILAKAVNCLNPKDGDPCNECENCRGIDSGSTLDVVEIDAASNNGVDNIRDLREETAYTPASAKYRVYIIDEAHMLSTGAFNALLKTLEEPPAYVIFILATTEVHKIPATVMSRCQRFDFRRIPQDDIIGRLNFVASQENINLDEAGAAMIARIADGGLRDALSLLDQCAGNGGLVDEKKVAAAAGLTGREYLFELSEAVAKHDNAAALRIIDGLYSSSKDVERLCEELIGHFRDLMVVKSVKNPFDIIACRTDEAVKLQECAQEFPVEALIHALDTLQDALETLKRSASGRVGMEVCLLRLCNPELDSSNTALLRRIKMLEDKIASGSFAAVAHTSVAPDRPAAAGNNAANVRTSMEEKAVPAGADSNSALPTKEGIPSSDSSADEPLNNWAEVLEALRKADAPLFGVLKTSSAIIRGGFVLIDPNNGMFSDLIRGQEHRKPLVEAVRRITGKPYKVGIFKKSMEKPAVQAEDPMDELADNASRAGIDVEQH
jgi:DNA polymerase-3 subunit gamma/tau